MSIISKGLVDVHPQPQVLLGVFVLTCLLPPLFTSGTTCQYRGSVWFRVLPHLEAKLLWSAQLFFSFVPV